MKRIKDYRILYESILKKECEEIIELLSKNNAYIYLTEKKIYYGIY